MIKLLGTIILSSVMMFATPVAEDVNGLKDIFNAEYYADSYADLKASFGYDEEALWNHFKKYGLKEGRCMSPVLDVVTYRGQYADLEEAFGNDWDAYVNHYFEYGMKEGRNNGTGFNAEYYLNAYGDLSVAFGNDYALAAKHFVEYGYKEDRVSQPATVTASAAAGQEPEEQMPPIVYEYDGEGNVIKESYYTNNQLMKVVEYIDEYVITTTYEYYASKNVSKIVEEKQCTCDEDFCLNYVEVYRISTSYYDKKGALKEEEGSYSNLIYKQSWYESGNVKYSEHFFTDCSIYKWYYDNTNNFLKKSVEEDFTHGTKTTREYDENGNLISKTTEEI